MDLTNIKTYPKINPAIFGTQNTDKDISQNSKRHRSSHSSRQQSHKKKSKPKGKVFGPIIKRRPGVIKSKLQKINL